MASFGINKPESGFAHALRAVGFEIEPCESRLNLRVYRRILNRGKEVTSLALNQSGGIRRPWRAVAPANLSGKQARTLFSRVFKATHVWHSAPREGFEDRTCDCCRYDRWVTSKEVTQQEIALIRADFFSV